MSIGECLLDDTRLYLVREEEKPKKKRFSLIRKQPKNDIKIFRKDFNHAEIIGEAICGIRNLRCAHFFLIGEGYTNRPHWDTYSRIGRQGVFVRLGSYDFRDMENHEYFKIVETGKRGSRAYLEDIIEMAPTDENRCELMDEIEELFALDTFMGQTDRIWSNVLFERNKKTKEIHLAPIYDFEYSLKRGYMDSRAIYENLLHPFRTKEDYIAFIEEHPEFAEKLKSYLDIDLEELVRRSYRSKGLRVPESKFAFYREFADERKQFIRSITK